MDYQKEEENSRLGQFFDNPVSRNAVILLATWCLNAVIGFIFIFMAARLYTIDAVGTAMVMFSYLSFIILASRFGIQQSMIGYYNEQGKSSIYWLTIAATTIPAIGMGILLIIFSELGYLGEPVISQYWIFFLIGLLVTSFSDVSSIFFLASGHTHRFLIQNIIICSRVVFIIVLISFGSLGIFSSLVIATTLAALFSCLMIRRQGVRFQIDDKKFLSDSLHFSATNYVCDFLMTAPIYLIPIIIFSIGGKEETAIYSVGYSIASIAFLIPSAIGYASFLSGSKENADIAAKKIFLPTIFIIIVVISVFTLWGKYIIGLLGPDYETVPMSCYHNVRQHLRAFFPDVRRRIQIVAPNEKITNS